ncbi:hypothetical protein L227DRAFT_575074 [Lentinus tigrinus ALCF2SS1-6]|uniref:Secreted protein n=1 Tax=Lentinus tigrinus ALCF2SS1-6 TaxID=1328759 RepID=A0A5C2SB46_9APHY|nr:hypothetical protein L227DRAFT_575074 [Lentinus tigrinus ALCF2SS1-6]
MLVLTISGILSFSAHADGVASPYRVSMWPPTHATTPGFFTVTFKSTPMTREKRDSSLTGISMRKRKDSSFNPQRRKTFDSTRASTGDSGRHWRHLKW